MNDSEPESGPNAVGPVLVTGATGHIGNVLVRELLSRNRQVRVLLPPGESTTPLAGLAVETFFADIRDPGTLAPAFDGTGLVFHLAGLIAIQPGQRRLMHEVNVTGTRNVVLASLQARVRRLVYTSSVHAFVEPPTGTSTSEDTRIDPERVLGDYGRSKALATQVVRDAIRQGLDAVVTFPSGVIGPYDFRRSEMGQLILDFVRGRLPAYVDGAYDFVDVRDVARGLVLAAEKGRRGEGYLLTGEIITVRGILEVLQKLTGIRSPRLCLPFRVARALALITPLYYALFRRKPRFTTYSLQVLKSNSLMDCSKACQDIGFTRRPIRESIADSLDWFRRAGLLKAA